MASIARRFEKDRHMHANPRRAFTLIELLVVISIIALLTAILLPALASARTVAQLTQAGSQARQLTVAVFAYAGDYNNVLPPASVGEDPPYWNQLIATGGYVDSGTNHPGDIFFSPAHFRRDGAHLNNEDWDTTGFGAAGWGTMAHANQGNLLRPPARSHDYRGPAPASALVIVDVSRYESNDSNADGYYDASHGDAWPFTYNGNVARSYLDGHVSTGNSLELKWQAYGPRIGEYMPGFSGTAKKTSHSAPWWGRHRHEDDPWGGDWP